MPSTNFTSGTVVSSTWLNEVDDHVFNSDISNTVINVKNTPYNCVGNGIIDDTVNFQQAITDAETAGVPLYIPAGTYKTTSSLTITKRLHMYGDGARASIISSSANEAVLVSVAVGYGNTFSYFHDFGIEPSTLGGGTSGFVCRLAPAGASYAYMSNFVITRVYIGDFGSYGMVFDNSVANGNGFFTFSVKRCWVSNGINAIKIGDSCNFEENTITDGGTILANKTGGRVGILYTGISGARQVVIRSNNITTSGGGLAIIEAAQVQIDSNQIEHPFYYNIPYGASGIYNSQIYLYNAAFCTLSRNTVQTGAGIVVTRVCSTFSDTNLLLTSGVTTDLYVGMTVSGPGIPVGTRIQSITDGTHIVLDNTTTGSSVGLTISFGLAADYAILLEGTNCAYNTLETSDVFKGSLYHLGFASGPGVPGLFIDSGNVFESAPNVLVPVVYNPDANINAKLLPTLTTATLPASISFPGGLVWDATTSTVKVSNGTSWTSLKTATTSAPTMVSIYYNPYFDLWTTNGTASIGPDGTSFAGFAVKETSIVYDGNPTAQSVKVTTNSTVLANQFKIVPSGQPWLKTETLSYMIPLYKAAHATHTVRLYSYDGASTTLLHEITADSAWHEAKGSFTVTAGNNWGFYVAVYDTSTGLFVNTSVFYVGGCNIVRGAIAPDTLNDSASRRFFVANNVTYTPPFIGCRAFVSGTGKWYMASDQASPADWILLN